MLVWKCLVSPCVLEVLEHLLVDKILEMYPKTHVRGALRCVKQAHTSTAYCWALLQKVDEINLILQACEINSSVFPWLYFVNAFDVCHKNWATLGRQAIFMVWSFAMSSDCLRLQRVFFYRFLDPFFQVLWTLLDIFLYLLGTFLQAFRIAKILHREALLLWSEALSHPHRFTLALFWFI